MKMRINSVHDVVHIDALKEIMALALVSVCAIPQQVHLDYLSSLLVVKKE